MDTRAGTNPLRTPGMLHRQREASAPGEVVHKACQEVGILSRGVKRELLLARKGSILSLFQGCCGGKALGPQAVSKNLKIVELEGTAGDHPV